MMSRAYLVGICLQKKNFTLCDWKFIQTLFSDSFTEIYYKNSFNTYQGFLGLTRLICM
jgi:hypothetical protein